jgi:ABC-type phosphate transport system substrate-binding protein
MRYLFFVLVASITSLTARSVDAQGYKVVVNAGNSVSSISRAQLTQLFLKKTTKWDDGTVVAPVDLGEKSNVRAAFSTDVHEKPVVAVKVYWQKQVFAGREVPPPTEKSDADVLSFVKAHKGAVGYVSEDTPADGVKVLKVTP